MAESKPIKYTDIASPNLLEPLNKEFKELLKLLGMTEKQLKAIVSESAKIAQQTPLTSFENLEKVEKGLNEAKKATEELDKVQKDRIKLEKQLETLQDERIKGNFELREQIRLQTKELRDNAKAAAAAGDAYEKLKKETNEAQLEAKRLAAEFGVNSEQAKEARKRFEQFDDQLREVNEAMRDGRRDVGRYQQATEKLTKTFKIFASATIVLKAFELISNGISRNSDGAAELEKIFARVTAVFTVFANRVVNAFPKAQAAIQNFVVNARIAFLQVTNVIGQNDEKIQELRKESERLEKQSEGLAKSFSGIIEETRQLITEQEKLIDLTLDLRRENVALEKQVAENIKTQQALRDAFEDDSTSLREQIENGVAYRDNLRETQALEAEQALNRLRIARQNAEANKQNVEAQENLSGAIREYNQLVADQASELATTEREIQKLRDDSTQLNLDFYVDDAQNRIDTNARVIVDETQTFERRRELLEENTREIEKANDLRAEALNKSLQERGKAELDFEELRKMTSSAEIARVIQESGISEPLAIRALEIIRERRTELQDAAEAQRDLSAAEAESRLIQNDLLLQQRALLALEKENIPLEKVLQELSEERLEAEIKNIRLRIAAAEDGSAEFLRLNQELNDKLLEQNQQRLEKEKQQLSELNDAAQTAFAVLGDISQKRSDERLSNIDDEISAEERRAERLQELAAQGNEDAEQNLALAQQRQDRLELERERQLQRQKRSELALTAIQTYGNKVTADEPNPLASTISDIAVLRAFVAALPGFYEGTEDTGKTGPLRDKFGAITGFTHENERVLNADQNRLVGTMTNNELAALAYRERTSSRADISPAVVYELQDLKKVIQRKPEYMGTDWDPLAESIAHKIKKGQTLERHHKKTGGIWGK